MGPRIIGGDLKGRKLYTARGNIIRPTGNRQREAIFNILSHRVREASVLDLFAGTGAFGIEALSRGAEWVDFVERKRLCCGIIKENLEKTRFTAQAHVYCCSVDKAISFLDKEYDIILMDPPYSDTSIGKLIEKLASSKLVGSNSILVVTHSPHFPLSSTYGALNLVKEYRHGDSCITLYKKEGVP